jgi:electron transport complex protein RnfB
METTSVYQELAQHLNHLPHSLDPDEDAVDPSTLRQFFSLQEAELALHLTLSPEEAAVIGERAGIPEAEAEQRLQGMLEKGLICCIHSGESDQECMVDRYAICVWRFHEDDEQPGRGKTPALPV